MTRIGLRTLLVGLCAGVSLAPSSSAQSQRDARDQPLKLLDYAEVKPGMVVGEAGAGEGYLAFFLARRVGEQGRVYANDIDEDSLERLKDRCQQEGVDNITTVLGGIADPLFPVHDLDLVTMLYAFHDFTEKAAWLKNVKKYMKKDAAIFIFDGRDAHTGLDRAAVESLAEEAGFELRRLEQLQGALWAYELRRKDQS